jgi:hypothetical protein
VEVCLQFAPKKPAKKAPKKAGAGAGEGGAGATESSDAFRDLIDQAKQAGKGARRNTGPAWGRNQNLQVAFGGGSGGTCRACIRGHALLSEYKRAIAKWPSCVPVLGALQ